MNDQPPSRSLRLLVVLVLLWAVVAWEIADAAEQRSDSNAEYVAARASSARLLSDAPLSVPPISLALPAPEAEPPSSVRREIRSIEGAASADDRAYPAETQLPRAPPL